MLLNDENKAAKNKNNRVVQILTVEWLVVGFVSNLFVLTQRTKYSQDTKKMKLNCVKSEIEYDASLN